MTLYLVHIWSSVAISLVSILSCLFLHVLESCGVVVVVVVVVVVFV